MVICCSYYNICFVIVTCYSLYVVRCYSTYSLSFTLVYLYFIYITVENKVYAKFFGNCKHTLNDLIHALLGIPGTQLYISIVHQAI